MNTLMMIQATAPTTSPSFFGLPLIVIQLLGFGAVFYFLILRPQGKAKRTHQSLLAALKKGDEVMTAGGIIGRVKDMKEVDVGNTKETRVTIDTGSSTIIVERGRIVRVGSSAAAGPATG